MDVVELTALCSWRWLPDYLGEDWTGWVVGLSCTRDAACLERANFQAALKALGGEQADKVFVARTAHWAVGWIDMLLVHESAVGQLQILADLRTRLEDYPVLDDDLLSQVEQEECASTLRSNREGFAKELAEFLDLQDEYGAYEAACVDAVYGKASVDEVLAQILGADDRGVDDAWIDERRVARWARGDGRYETDKLAKALCAKALCAKALCAKAPLKTCRQVVVLNDGETWASVDTCTLVTLTAKGAEKVLGDGADPGDADDFDPAWVADERNLGQALKGTTRAGVENPLPEAVQTAQYTFNFVQWR